MNADALPPRDFIASSVRRTRSSLVSASKTSAPSCANSIAAACPLPTTSPRDPAPVTMAILFSSLGFFSVSFIR